MGSCLPACVIWRSAIRCRIRNVWLHLRILERRKTHTDLIHNEKARKYGLFRTYRTLGKISRVKLSFGPQRPLSFLEYST